MVGTQARLLRAAERVEELAASRPQRVVEHATIATSILRDQLPNYSAVGK